VVMCVVTAVLYITVPWIERVSVVLLVWGRGELLVMCVVTAVLFYHSAMDTESECCVVIVG
jgi:hypothetical protein